MTGQTDFLVLHQYGPGPADLEVCGLFPARTADEGEQVIREGLNKGPGRYVALKLTGATELEATEGGYELAPPSEGG